MKTYKTVAGYLRAAESRIVAQQSKDRRSGRKPISDADAWRQLLNHLFRQRGFGTIRDDEMPLAGIDRLLGELDGEAAKVLRTCREFLDHPVYRTVAL